MQQSSIFGTQFIRRYAYLVAFILWYADLVAIMATLAADYRRYAYLVAIMCRYAYLVATIRGTPT